MRKGIIDLENGALMPQGRVKWDPELDLGLKQCEVCGEWIEPRDLKDHNGTMMCFECDFEATWEEEEALSEAEEKSDEGI